MKKICILLAIAAIYSCTSNKSIDDSIYEIRISNKSVSKNTDLANNWLSTTATKMEVANLFQCMNPGFEYGHITVAKWDDLEKMATAHGLKSKPKDKLHRAYKRIAESPSEAIGEYYIIIVYDFENGTNTDSNLKPQWDLISIWMQDQKGFNGASLYESISKDATYKYITISNWDNLIDSSNILSSNEFMNLIKNRASSLNKKSNIYSLVKSK